MPLQNTENKVVFIHSALTYWCAYMWEEGGKKSKVYFFGELLAAFLRDANILFPLASTDVHVAHAYLSCREI